MICFYHATDLDGHCSGAIVKHAHPECKLVGVDYGKSFPWREAKGQDVIMVDFSLQPWPAMEKLMDDARTLTWIDHHKSAMVDCQAWMVSMIGADEAPPPLAEIKVDDGERLHFLLNSSQAACELCWQHFFPERDMPEAVRLLGRYDVWDHEDPQALPFQWAMRQYDTRPGVLEHFWSELFNDASAARIIPEEVNKGQQLLNFKRRENMKYCAAYAYEAEFFGLRAIVANAGLTNSMLFDGVFDPERHDLMVAWARIKDGRWRVSLYSDKPEVDCWVIAKTFGGGGHKGAAGFTSNELPAELLG